MVFHKQGFKQILPIGLVCITIGTLLMTVGCSPDAERHNYESQSEYKNQFGEPVEPFTALSKHQIAAEDRHQTMYWLLQQLQTDLAQYVQHPEPNDAIAKVYEHRPYIRTVLVQDESGWQTIDQTDELTTEERHYVTRWVENTLSNAKNAKREHSELQYIMDGLDNVYVVGVYDESEPYNELATRQAILAIIDVGELESYILNIGQAFYANGHFRGLADAHYYSGEVTIFVQEDCDIDRWLEAHPDYIVHKKNTHYAVISHPKLAIDALVEELNTDNQIVAAEPNYIFEKQSVSARADDREAENNTVQPNDEFFHSHQWNLEQIGALRGWGETTGSDDVIVAVLDTGVDVEHEDLSDRLAKGFNAFDESDDVHDGNGHGTHVAGIVAAVTDNENGIAGLTWENTLLPVKVLNDEGEGSLYEVASGIRWAVDQGAQVINMSLGDHEDSRILRESIHYAYENDVVLIAAAGNDNTYMPMYPAAYPEVLAVSAVTPTQQKAIFSNYGDHIDVCAPGEHVPSTFPQNQYVFMSGTSMAAPHVSGLAGLLRTHYDDWNNDQVLTHIKETSEDIGPQGVDPYFGHGEINVARALQQTVQEEQVNEMGDSSVFERLLQLLELFPGQAQNAAIPLVD